MLAGELSDEALLRGIPITVQQAHRERLDPISAEGFDEPRHLLALEQPVDRAVGEDPLVQLEAELARRERRRTLHEQVVHVVAMLAPDLDRIAISLRRD